MEEEKAASGVPGTDALSEQQTQKEAELARREQELARKEALLAQQEERIVRKGLRERAYDRIKIPVRYLDYLIGAVVVALVVVVILGMLKGRGFF